MKKLGFAIVLSGVAGALSCSDPVHDSEVKALGPEVGQPGPLHRPGQPCLVCHDGSGPGSTKFSVAGTIYQVQGDSTPLEGAKVHLVDANGSKVGATTNSAGNFFVPASVGLPTFPLSASIEYQGATADMHTRIGRDGSCGSCHFDPPGRESPGRVYLVVDPADLPGASP